MAGMNVNRDSAVNNPLNISGYGGTGNTGITGGMSPTSFAPSAAPQASGPTSSGKLTNAYGTFDNLEDFVAKMGQGGWGDSGKQGASAASGVIKTFDDPNNSGQGNLKPGGQASMAGLISVGGGNGGMNFGGGTSGGGGSSSGGDAYGGGGDGGGSGGGPGGAKVVDPESGVPSMQGLQSAGGPGGGDAGANMISGPTRFRQNIGARMIPDQNSALAGLRKVY